MNDAGVDNVIKTLQHVHPAQSDVRFSNIYIYIYIYIYMVGSTNDREDSLKCCV